MKKLLFALLVFAPFMTRGLTEPEMIQNFLDVVQSQKDDWFKYNQEEHAAKIQLMRDHLKQKVDLVKKNVGTIKGGQNVLDFYKLQLDSVRKLYDTQRNNWKDLAIKWHEKALELYDEHTDELNELAKSLGDQIQEEMQEEDANEIESD